MLLMSLNEAPAPALPNLIAGMLFVVMGALSIIHRKRIYAATVRGEKRWFGRGIGEFLERLQSPFWIGFAGLLGVLMGAAAIVYALFRFVNP